MRPVLVMSICPDRQGSRVHLTVDDLDVAVDVSKIVELSEFLRVPPPGNIHDVPWWLPEVLREAALRYERSVMATSDPAPQKPSFTPIEGQGGLI
jgi:hypothetical protein